MRQAATTALEALLRAAGSAAAASPVNRAAVATFAATWPAPAALRDTGADAQLRDAGARLVAALPAPEPEP